MKAGDLVILKFSKAKHLKNKAFKILAVESSTVRVVTYSGKHKHISSYMLEPIQSHKHRLEANATDAQNKVIAEGKKAMRHETILRNFDQELLKIDTLFPRI